jgi:hypothetical protein
MACTLLFGRIRAQALEDYSTLWLALCPWVIVATLPTMRATSPEFTAYIFPTRAD